MGCGRLEAEQQETRRLSLELGDANRQLEGYAMSSHDTHDDDNAPVPWMQQLLDNPFLLLFLGVFVPMMVYTVWGVVDILTLPMAK